MEQDTVLIKTEGTSEIEILLEQKPFIAEEKDLPEYVNINSFSKIDSKPKATDYVCEVCPAKYKTVEYLEIHSAIHNPCMYCPVCRELFDCRKKIKRHINEHIRLKMEEERKQSLICTYCKKKFNTRKEITLHLRVHTNERPYKCEICGEGFKQLGGVKVHYITHTKEKRFKCEICNGAFTTSSSLTRHKKKIHEKGKTLDCKYCNAKFHNQADYYNHKSEHRDNRFNKTCPVCSAVFMGGKAYKKHILIHADEKSHVKFFTTYHCNLCGAEKENLQAYKEHRLVHLSYSYLEMKEAVKTKSFQCKFCPVAYRHMSGLFKHMDQHIESNISCDLCDFETTYINLKSHKRNAHHMFECLICRSFIKGKRKLNQHNIKYHKVNVCKICGNKYSSKELLHNHVKLVHPYVKNFKCTICKKRFFSSATLMSHEKKTHSFEFKLRCFTCKELFETQEEIDAHVSTHKEDASKKPKAVKRLQCKECKKLFISPTNYKFHMALRKCKTFVTKQRLPYFCELCQKGYARSGTLKKHMQCHSNFEYQCQFCDKKYKLLDSIKKHLRKAHPNKKLCWCDLCGGGFETDAEYESHLTTHSAKKETMEVDETSFNNSVDINYTMEIKKEEVFMNYNNF